MQHNFVATSAATSTELGALAVRSVFVLWITTVIEALSRQDLAILQRRIFIETSIAEEKRGKISLRPIRPAVALPDENQRTRTLRYPVSPSSAANVNTTFE